MANQPENMPVWVLAGQSNMEGVGLLSGAMPADERVWSFTNAGQWEVASDPLHCFWESSTPVHRNLLRPGLAPEQQQLSDEELAAQSRATRVCGAGLGIAFGARLSEWGGEPIGLIPTAHGGTSLEQWAPTADDPTGETLYGSMLLRIRQAGGRVDGILWYQGESDTWGDVVATSYAQRLEQWIARVRQDLNMPDLPVIVVQLGRFLVPLDAATESGWGVVREALATLPERVPNTAVTSAVDLGLSDIIHIDAPGLHRLGRRMARLAFAITTEHRQPDHPRVTSIKSIPWANGMGALHLTCTNVARGWLPRQNMSGFSLHTEKGDPHPDIWVIDASADAKDPTNLRIILNLPPDNNTYLAYGSGTKAYCNVVDENDTPLCAFLPRKVEP